MQFSIQCARDAETSGRIVIRRIHEQTGVKNLSSHDWRRTFAGDLLDAGAGMATVEKLMGHADPATTARYDPRGEETRRRAVALLHVQYRKRVEIEAETG